jgi:hypothetical protein
MTERAEERKTEMDQQRKNGLVWGAGLVAAGAIAGVVLAATLPAGAQTPTPSPSTGTQTAPRDPSKATHEGEALLTGTNADKAKAAALKALPGATIERVETDSDGDVYEAHVVKADGTRATVKFDKDFNVLRVETGGHGHGGDDSTSSSSSA